MRERELKMGWEWIERGKWRHGGGKDRKKKYFS